MFIPCSQLEITKKNNKLKFSEVLVKSSKIHFHRLQNALRPCKKDFKVLPLAH